MVPSEGTKPRRWSSRCTSCPDQAARCVRFEGETSPGRRRGCLGHDRGDRPRGHGRVDERREVVGFTRWAPFHLGSPRRHPRRQRPAGTHRPGRRETGERAQKSHATRPLGASHQSINSDWGNTSARLPRPGCIRQSLSTEPRYKPVTGARQRHVQQSLRLLPFPRRVIVVGLGLEVADRHDARLPRWVGDHADRDRAGCRCRAPG